ncbi:MAG: glucose-6-phosphate isomerase [Planctomycetota bacterium]|jgi:glucose-6-phosphate isomerase
MGIRCEWARLEGTGLSGEEWEAAVREADAAADAVTSAGFATDLDRASEALPPATSLDRVVVLGIGGSALGARCVHEATRTAAHKPIEVVDNIDPEAFESVWLSGDPARTCWVVVSKSGGTTETLAQFGVLRQRLRESGATGEIYVVTGPTGALRAIAEAEGYPTGPVPEDVGGRFSVFTPAATMALALAGHDVAALLDGARAMRDHCATAGSASARLAALLAASARKGRNVVALWSYAERLETVGEWFRQLWAESLGKVRADGERVGQTPIHCVGSTDQHSIQQLLVEGPRDKVALVLAGPSTGSTVAPAGEAGAGAGHALADILTAMRRATTAGMVKAGCPTATFTLNAWDERSLGELLTLFLAATVQAGPLFGVDPYGQPGVEAAKVATMDLLSQPDGDASQKIADLLGENDGVAVP